MIVFSANGRIFRNRGGRLMEFSPRTGHFHTVACANHPARPAVSPIAQLCRACEGATP